MGNTASTRVRLADVAREAGVSKAAVSFAFNKPDRLSAETAARIRAVAASMGYRPAPRRPDADRRLDRDHRHPVAAGPGHGRSPTRSSRCSRRASRRSRRSAASGCCSSRPSTARCRGRSTGRPWTASSAVGLDERHPEVESIRRAGLPVVLVDAPAWEEHGPSAWTTKAARGRRGAPAAPRPPQFLVISVEPPTWRAAARERRGAAHARLPGDTAGGRGGARSSDVVVSPATYRGRRDRDAAGLEDGLRPTAVLSMSDAAAAGVVGRRVVLGLRVPDDLSVVGFDDLPLTRFTDPPLTTVHQPVRRKGEEAARLLLAALSAPAGEATAHQRSWRRGWWSVVPRRPHPSADVWRWSLRLTPPTSRPCSRRATRHGTRGGSDPMKRPVQGSGACCATSPSRRRVHAGGRAGPCRVPAVDQGGHR